jgi:hypothetical protein
MTTNIKSSLPRSERRVKNTLSAAQLEAQRLERLRLHPVTSGLVPIVQYVPPSGNGRPTVCPPASLP